MTIQSPPGWGVDQIRLAVHSIGSATPAEYWHTTQDRSAAPTVRRIGMQDLRIALTQGLEDFKANRTDVIFLCVIYPVVGLLLARLASGYGLLPLLFPLASGFALVGPVAAIGLNEMSRRREAGETVRWVDAFGVLRAPSIGAITLLALMLVGVFVLWLVAAQVIYVATLGPEAPVSAAAFAHDVVGTIQGWALIAMGVGAGFLFAVLVLAISVVSFPLLLDRDVGIDTAVWASVRAVAVNPGIMAVWGAIIVAALVVGSIPALVGLAVVMPVLGHATWHLYRRMIAD
jgi:uncharacterized membrane protein